MDNTIIFDGEIYIFNKYAYFYIMGYNRDDDQAKEQVSKWLSARNIRSGDYYPNEKKIQEVEE